MITDACSTKATEIENKIPDLTNVASKPALNKKATEVESKIPDITNLATKAAVNTKATEIEKEIRDTTGFITTPKFNKLTKSSFDTRRKDAAESLVSQMDTALNIVDKNRENVWLKLF